MNIENESKFFKKHDEMNSEEKEEIYQIGIKRAQEIGKKEGLKIGQVVVHPNEDMAYELKEIIDERALVWLPGQEETIKEFPLEELFDPNVAREQALQETAKRGPEKHPEINN